MAFLASNDWCFTAVTAGLVGAAVAGILDHFVRLRLPATRLTLPVRMLVAVVVGCIIGLLFRLDHEQTFERAFGLAPPAGVRLLRIERHYAGGPGDEAVLMEFVADRETLQAIVAGRPFEQAAETAELYAGDWQRLWRHAFSNFDSLASWIWGDVQPMAEPALYHWTNIKLGPGTGEPPLQTTLLWDAETGRAYALFIIG